MKQQPQNTNNGEAAGQDSPVDSPMVLVSSLRRILSEPVSLACWEEEAVLRNAGTDTVRIYASCRT